MGHTEDIIKMIESLGSSIKAIKGSGGKWWEKLDATVQLVVKSVEELHTDFAGEDKKALAEGVILEIYFKNFNSRYIPNFIEKPLAKKLIAYIVDRAIEAWVFFYNRTGVFKTSK